MAYTFKPENNLKILGGDLYNRAKMQIFTAQGSACDKDFDFSSAVLTTPCFVEFVLILKWSIYTTQFTLLEIESEKV